MRDIDDLLPQVLPHAPSCPEPLAVRYLREAAIELAEKAKFWRENEKFTAGASDFVQLVPFEDARILQIENARFDGRPIEAVDPLRLDNILPDWLDEDAPEGIPAYITQSQPGIVTLARRTAGVLRLRCLLVPSNDATTLPDFMVDQHGIEIGKGALGRILLHPNGEWSNPQLGTLHLAEFQTILARSHRKALKGQQNAPLRTNPSFF